MIAKEKEPDYAAQAHALASKIFKPEEWTEDLMNRMLPVLAVSMAEAAVAHLLTLGVDVRKKKGKKKGLKHGSHDQSTHGRGGGGSGTEPKNAWIDHSKRPAPDVGETMGTGSRVGTIEEAEQFITNSKFQETFYHGSAHSEDIALDGFEPSDDEANWSPGVSFGRTVEDSRGYEGDEGGILQCKLDIRKPVEYGDERVMSNVKERGLDEVGDFDQVAREMGFDAVYGPGEMRVFLPEQIFLVGEGIGDSWEPSYTKSFTKATTAAEWAEDNDADWDELLETFASSDVPIGILNEIPPWMQESIAARLNQSFGEGYWVKVSETTMGNAETVLRQGLERGESIAEMSGRLRKYYTDGGFRYARGRAENVARTESGNALNGARKDSVKRLQDELGDEVPMKQSWLSILGNTTRASHADLDGVPENKRGMWMLDGVEVPWPAHISLPPENRCNCQCSLTIEFGMKDSEAEKLIEEHEERVVEGTEGEVAEALEQVEKAPIQMDDLAAELERISLELERIREQEKKERAEGKMPTAAELDKRRKARKKLRGEYEDIVGEIERRVENVDDMDDEDFDDDEKGFKHGDHDQSTHGRGGGGGTEEAMEKLNALPVNNGWVEAGDVFAETADGEPYEDISGYQEEDLKAETVPIDKLISTQSVLEKSTLEKFIQDPDATPGPGVGDKPFVVKAGRSYYIHDGHHRIGAEKLLGKTEVTVSVLAGRVKMDDEDWDDDDY